MHLEIPADALRLLRRYFVTVEGACEPWTDLEVARRVLIRGAMEYVRSAGGDFAEMQQVAGELREQLGA